VLDNNNSCSLKNNTHKTNSGIVGNNHDNCNNDDDNHDNNDDNHDDDGDNNDDYNDNTTNNDDGSATIKESNHVYCLRKETDHRLWWTSNPFPTAYTERDIVALQLHRPVHRAVFRRA
jgi:hypothetical protein